MKTWVVDASVLAAAFLPEECGEAARALFAGKHHFYAPDLIYAETANVIWKRHSKGEISGAEAAQLLADILALPIRIVPSMSWLPRRWRSHCKQNERPMTAFILLWLSRSTLSSLPAISGW